MFLISFSINLLRGENEKTQLGGGGGGGGAMEDHTGKLEIHTPKVLCHDFS